MEHIQEISIALSVVLVLLGGLGWLYTLAQQPDLVDGEYFESAWLDIQEEQLTVYVEFVPDGHGRGVLAVAEAVCRVKSKSWINPSIDGRPIVAIGMVRQKTVLVPLSAVVIYDNQQFCGKDIDPQIAMRKSAQNMTFLYNDTTIDVVNRQSGEKFAVNISDYKSTAMQGNFQLETYSVAPVIFKYPECVE